MKTDLQKTPEKRDKRTGADEGRAKPGKISRAVPVLGLLLLLGGAAVFLYPAVSNYLAEKNQTRVIQTYQEAVGGLSDEELSEEWAKAEEYNENLTGDPVHDPFLPGSGYALPDNYLDVLNTDGVMCYIEIPKIDVSLPVYHGTAEETLEKGVGHMESTTLPIGGVGRHAVLTGHRGLPSAELFTNLDLLEIGDHFYINVLGETLAYEVDRIEVVEPDELELLAAEPGRDLVTLITCTPYGVNTHRLLVRGERTEYVPEEAQREASAPGVRTDSILYMAVGIIAGLLLLGLALLFFFIWKKRRKEEGQRTDKKAKKRKRRTRRRKGARR